MPETITRRSFLIGLGSLGILAGCQNTSEVIIPSIDPKTSLPVHPTPAERNIPIDVNSDRFTAWESGKNVVAGNTRFRQGQLFSQKGIPLSGFTPKHHINHKSRSQINGHR